MKYIFIINPTAGKVNAHQTLEPLIRAASGRTGLPVEIVTTERPGHATELARAFSEPGEKVRLYACGGDGTLNEVLMGAYPYENAEVGHIPCGSGNDMIRNFGSVSDFSDLERMLHGSSKKIDLIQMNGRIAASICAAGLDAKVAYNIPLFRRIPLCGGSAAYDLAVLKCLIEKLGYHMTIESDAGRFEDDFLLVAVGNGSYYGGGYNSVPVAKLDDGLLNVVLAKKMSLLRIAPTLKRYKLGTHFTPDGQIVPDLRDVMITFATQSMRIRCDREFYYTLDGESAPAREMEIRVLPLAARFILPDGLVPAGQ